MLKELTKEADICEHCGRFGAIAIGDHQVCEDCYEGAGSCCPEFGADDLWRFDDAMNQAWPAER